MLFVTNRSSMYQLWVLQKETHRPAHQIYRLRTSLKRQMPALWVEPLWVEIDFDNAVTILGRWIEARLSETEIKTVNGKEQIVQKYQLSELLKSPDDEENNEGTAEDLIRLLTGVQGALITRDKR